MKSCRPPLFRNRQFEPALIVTCLRWYFRFSLSLRDLEKLMAERGLSVDDQAESSCDHTIDYSPDLQPQRATKV